MKKIFIVLCVLSMLGTAHADTVKVGISTMSPFVISETQGFSINLWNTVAMEAGLKTEFVLANSFDEKMELLDNGGADILIGGVSITAAREKLYDFSTPTFNSGLGVLVKKQSQQENIALLVAKRLFTKEIGVATACFLVGLMFWGLLLYLAEKGSDVIRDKFSEGYADACWCALAIKTTIGFGDKYPVKWMGRALTIPIFLSGVVLLGTLTAPINAAFVVRDIDTMNQTIKTKSDLMGKVIATKVGTASETALKDMNIHIVPCSSLGYAAVLLKAGDVDAVVYDRPALIHKTLHSRDLQVLDVVFNEHHYGFVFREDSDGLQERVNAALLKLYENGTYSAIYKQWFQEN